MRHYAGPRTTKEEVEPYLRDNNNITMRGRNLIEKCIHRQRALDPPNILDVRSCVYAQSASHAYYEELADAKQVSKDVGVEKHPHRFVFGR